MSCELGLDTPPSLTTLFPLIEFPLRIIFEGNFVLSLTAKRVTLIQMQIIHLPIDFSVEFNDHENEF